MITDTKEITNSDDVIDVRDVIARFEELENELPEDAETNEDEEIRNQYEDLAVLRSLLEDLEGNGGDEEWRGSWYPITLVRDSYFQDYAQELADDIGAVNAEATWPNNHIDWESASEELKQDYSTVEFDGVTYWYW